MNKNVFGMIMFAAGAAIGSVVTWRIVKTKYERIADEEIESVRDEYGRLMKLMRKEIEACRNVIDTNKNEADENEDDESYPDDDDRGFTEHEQEMIDYYKLTSAYRSKDNEDDENGNKNEGKGDGEDEVPYINGPYVISPEEFSSSPPGYNAQPLDYFADGILADSWGVELDIDESIGDDAINHFGDYDDDIVYVRNERNEIDYEVTRDPRTYDEAIRTNPNPYYGQ